MTMEESTSDTVKGPVLQVEGLTKTFSAREETLTVLKGVDLSLRAGDSLSIVGPSGSGKTTLLGLCAGLDSITQGSVRLMGEALENLDEDERARIRMAHIGFIFQDFQLLETLTALENVMVPLELKGVPEARKRALELLDRVGLSDRAGHYPTQLSGGEKQRVAIARAFSGEPAVLFADEPTGDLDEVTGSKVEELLFRLNEENRTALVLVTHDKRLASRTDRSLRLQGGEMVPEGGGN